MIQAGHLHKQEILTHWWGESRVFETLRVLRGLGVYPKYRELTAEEAATALYCLAATTGKNIHEDVLRAEADLPYLVDSEGKAFLSHLAQLFKEERLLHTIKEISFCQQYGLAIIQAPGVGANLYLDSRIDFDTTAIPAFYTTLPAKYLKKFAGVLYGRQMETQHYN